MTEAQREAEGLPDSEPLGEGEVLPGRVGTGVALIDCVSDGVNEAEQHAEAEKQAEVEKVTDVQALALGHLLTVGVAVAQRLPLGEAEVDRHFDGEALSD